MKRCQDCQEGVATLSGRCQDAVEIHVGRRADHNKSGASARGGGGLEKRARIKASDQMPSDAAWHAFAATFRDRAPL